MLDLEEVERRLRLEGTGDLDLVAILDAGELGVAARSASSHAPEAMSDVTLGRVLRLVRSGIGSAHALERRLERELSARNNRKASP